MGVDSECDSSLLRSLAHWIDRDLLAEFQRDPNSARYFIALYCRHHPALVQRGSQVLSGSRLDTFLAHLWQTSFLRLQQIPTDTDLAAWLSQQLESLLTTWNEDSADPPVRRIPIPLACYLTSHLKQMSGLMRFVLVLADHFSWTVPRIRVQLATEGMTLSEVEVNQHLTQARQALFEQLPGDIRALYLASKP
ncbi:MAG: hypothetical protein OHK0012_03780 [Synechococcales cyanobacterium]